MTSESYVCDTIPAARLATSSSNIQQSSAVDDVESLDVSETVPKPPPPPRKLCVRHQRMADEGTNLKLQQVRSSCAVLSFFFAQLCV